MIVAVLAFAAALVQTAPAQVQAGGQTEAAATAATAEAPASAANAPAADEKPRMICTNEQVTGSRFPIRRCHSSRQTEAERAESREMLRQLQGARTEPVG